MKQEQENSKRNFALEYDSSWNRYDFIVNLFQLGRDRIHRLKALKLAGLKEGDTVLDLCCGSGLSIEATRSIIGPSGKIIAVDANSKMLALAENRTRKNNWNNVQFIEADIELLNITEKVDFVLFAFCWYDRVLCTSWVKKVSQFLDPEKGKLCFIDYKLPDNWLRHLVTPLLWILVKWLGEAYGLDELKWNPKEEIGSLLKNPEYHIYYLDCIVTVSGKPTSH